MSEVRAGLIGERLNDVSFEATPEGTFIYDRFTGQYGRIIVNGDPIQIEFKRPDGGKDLDWTYRHLCGHIEIAEPDRARYSFYGKFHYTVYRALSFIRK